MAETLVVGALVSGLFNVVLDRLISREAFNLTSGKKLDGELVERLKTALLAVKSLLLDAEMKQFHDKDVQDWLNSLRDAVYEADDLLDLVFTKAAIKKKVSNFSSRLSSIINSQDRRMVKKMEKIVTRIENLEKPKHIVELKDIPRENLAWRVQSTSLVGGSIYGREKDQEAIINMLLNDNIEGEISVISIVGIGGIGKTTLAQLVYNDENFIKKFDLKAWVSVSEEDDVLKLTKSIINAFTSGTCDRNDLNLLQHDLKEQLSGKKFFVVLDDVWNIDCYGWDNLKKPFQFGAKGSKILVTTRHENVASTFQTCPPYLLNELPEEHCWSIFAKHACFPESNGNSKLEKIGKGIVKKCKGLPLAAATLGRLLQNKDEIEDWKKILTSNIWEFSLKDSKIIPALLISYYHLPPHLKRCFAYCSLFPKDYMFYKDELILLWMAEDLLPPSKSDESLEKVGYQCLDDLVSRLFLKQSSTSGESFVMHDLLHDLAVFVAGNFYIRLEDLDEVDKISIHIRHLSFGRVLNYLNDFDVLDQVKSLRTFMLTNFSTPSLVIKSSACTKVSKLKHLRVLSFRDFRLFYKLPKFIGELISLRYLDLSRTSIKTLPESLGNLYNLQILKLYACRELVKLPSSMQNLLNLRHLDINQTDLKEMPKGMGKLKHLQCLCYFVLSKHKENEMKELGGLSNLRGSLEIRNLDNVSNNGEAWEARIMDMKHIDHLLFQWLSSALREADMDIFDGLQPHTNLKELTIHGYRATGFPNWVGLSSYHSMTSVSLLNCRYCLKLPSLGRLPSLKSLRIEGFNWLKIIGAEFYKNDDDHSLATPFQSLEYLSFREMDCWVEWLPSESDGFPKLKCLQIQDCPVLTRDLPNHLPALEKLQIKNCSLFNGDLPNHLPALEELQIKNCTRFNGDLPNHLPALEELQIMNCSRFNGDLPKHLPTLEELQIKDCSEFNGELPNHLPSLKILEINDCRQLNRDLPNHLPSLKTLNISNCIKFNGYLPNHLPALEVLVIVGCELVDSPPPRNPTSSNKEVQELSFSLQSAVIEGCKSVGSMFQAMAISNPSCLRYLKITSCGCDMSFPNGCLPESLKQLEIRDCRKLEFPKQHQQRHEALESLAIDNSCDSLTSFTLDVFPNLSKLCITACENLESLSLLQSQHTALGSLDIDDCPNFVSFPREGLAAPSLIYFSVSKCNKLKSLPCHMNTLLPKLEHLLIEYCPEIDSFPTGGLPPNLRTLEIYNCEKLLSGLSSMGMLEGLTYLTIAGGSESVKSFPKEGLLPQLPSLRYLYLSGFSRVDTLECKELLHLTSLQKLTIYNCPKLENMTGERLPASLIKLVIDGCPLLEEWCENKRTQIWPKISHIRSIEVKMREINFVS